MESGTILTNKNMKMMVSWLTGDGIPRPEFAERFMTTLHLLYMNRSGDAGSSLRRRRGLLTGGAALSLRAIAGDIFPPVAPAAQVADRPVAERTDRPAAGSEDGKLPLSGAQGHDSIGVAFAVRDIHERIQESLDKPRQASMSLIQAVLYIAYGIFLSERKERLFGEPPQMWKYGPVFARVYTKMPALGDAYRGAGERLREEDPRLHAILDSGIRYCIDLGMRRVSGILTGEGSPWKRSLEEHPDRWGTVIDDGLIADWFSHHPILSVQKGE